ncbi:MAG: hypothetical protein K0Q72_86 [Armatimonadetes bacterium]|jgi:hypothetical protein|nr:hypothetical protein [Armatimonadota bacterium]
MNERLRTRIQFCALVLSLLAVGASSSALAALVRPSAPGDEALNGAGWEGRRLIAQMLWVKTHAVLHAGAEERTARPGEEKTRSGEFHRHGGEGDDHHDGESPEEHAAHAGDGDHAGESPAEHAAHSGDGEGHHAGETPEEHAAHAGEASERGDEHGEDGHVLVIPPASEDFRGPLGDLERAVKPYSGADGQLYSKDSSQTLPFYRLMTWADPHYIQGYTVGSTFINKMGKNPDPTAALEFLEEGARFNPRSFEIQTELGHLYLVYRKDYAAAERHLRRALDLIPTRKLTDLEDEARTDAIRWLALNYVQWGKADEAVRLARYGRGLIGPDAALDHIIARKGQK